jgi:hypothetical protein
MARSTWNLIYLKLVKEGGYPTNKNTPCPNEKAV